MNKLETVLEHIISTTLLSESLNTNFEQWLEKMGGLDSVLTEYDIDLDERYYYLVDDYKEQELNLEEIKEKLEDEFSTQLEDKFYDWQYHYESKSYPLTLYRAICVTKPEDINFDNIGIFWTDDLYSAICHWGGTKTKHIIEAEVEMRDVDWDLTLYHNMNPDLGDEEKEFNLHKGSEIKIVDVILESNQESVGGNIPKIANA